jgi:hypothetical protein
LVILSDDTRRAAEILAKKLSKNKAGIDADPDWPSAGERRKILKRYGNAGMHCGRSSLNNGMGSWR